jgi:hypothetical protein
VVAWAMRFRWSLLLLAPVLACSPGRTVQGFEVGDGSDSDSDAPGDSEGAVPDATDTDTDSGGNPPWGGCKHEGPMAYLDFCEPEDPCDAVACAACIGGLCVEPAASEVCEGVVLTALGINLPEARASVWVDVDGQPGDELVSADTTPTDWSVRTFVHGAEVVSAFTGAILTTMVTPLRYDGDGFVDLLVDQNVHDPGNIQVLLGDGEGGFMLAPQPLADGIQLDPVVLDFDGDGADDLFVHAYEESLSRAYRNVGGGFEPAATFMVAGQRASAADVDGDGARDDLLIGSYPSPEVLLGGPDGLSYAEALPSSERGPQFEYGLGRPLAADLDGDGWIDVVSVIEDNHGRAGIRIWAGIGPGQFGPPRDQLVVDQGWNSGGVVDLVGVAELDGVAPPELLLSVDHELLYLRADLDGGRPLACAGLLFEHLDRPPSVGDLDADGWLELAIDSAGLDIYTTLP